jgi:hypothetical protein
MPKKVSSPRKTRTAQQGKERFGPVVVIGKEPYEVVVVTAMSKISFGKYLTREARSLTAAINASPRMILEIERWFALSGTSELHLSRMANS